MRFLGIFLSLNHTLSLNADSRRQCLKPSGRKTHKKIFGAYVLVKQVKIRPEINFFAIFLSLVHSFSLILYRIEAWDNI